jgi:nicotinamide riboside kinase
MAAARNYDLYLLLDIDVPWVNDGQRFFNAPADRKAFFDLCEKALQDRGKRYVIVRGNWQERFDTAVREVETLLRNI